MSRMFTVALIGPDGAGKTTVARRLEDVLELPVKYLYMGINPDSSNHLLPTTRLVRTVKRARGAKPDAGGPRDSRDLRKPRPKGAARRVLALAKAPLRLANRLAEEWYRQCLAWYHVRRGTIVVFDRHFFSDYYAYDIAGGSERPLSRRIHGFLLSRVYPAPDLVIYLDAPSDVLLARKGEGTIESLERRRGEYLELAPLVENFAVVDASGPLDDVTRGVAELICRFAATARVDQGETGLRP